MSLLLLLRSTTSVGGGGLIQLDTPNTLYDRKVQSQQGRLTVFLGTYQLPASYPAGGEAVTPVGTQQVVFMRATTPGYVITTTNGRFKVFRSGSAGGALAEVTAGTDLSASTADVMGLVR